MRRLGATFRRARRLPLRAACPRHTARVQRTLTRLHHLEQAGACQVWYGDESGFCLQPPLPYLWQKKGHTLGVRAQSHGRRWNVLGFLRQDNTLHTAPTEKTVTAAHFISSVESLLAQHGHGPHVVVLDNAAIHRSKDVRAKRREWKARGLRVFFLPPYSPHLNKIERLWRHIKYHWLPPQAYTDFATLCESVTDILKQVGGKYCISFA